LLIKELLVQVRGREAALAATRHRITKIIIWTINIASAAESMPGLVGLRLRLRLLLLFSVVPTPSYACVATASRLLLSEFVDAHGEILVGLCHLHEVLVLTQVVGHDLVDAAFVWRVRCLIPPWR